MAIFPALQKLTHMRIKLICICIAVTWFKVACIFGYKQGPVVFLEMLNAFRS